jgi:hypothetical protein
VSRISYFIFCGRDLCCGLDNRPALASMYIAVFGAATHSPCLQGRYPSEIPRMRMITNRQFQMPLATNKSPEDRHSTNRRKRSFRRLAPSACCDHTGRRQQSENLFLMRKIGFLRRRRSFSSQPVSCKAPEGTVVWNMFSISHRIHNYLFQYGTRTRSQMSPGYQVVTVHLQSLGSVGGQREKYSIVVHVVFSVLNIRDVGQGFQDTTQASKSTLTIQQITFERPSQPVKFIQIPALVTSQWHAISKIQKLYTAYGKWWFDLNHHDGYCTEVSVAGSGQFIQTLAIRSTYRMRCHE